MKTYGTAQGGKNNKRETCDKISKIRFPQKSKTHIDYQWVTKLASPLWDGIDLYLISYYLFPNDLCSSGLFGDMFGGINALFSGLAFVGIILTIYLQKRELSLQREELVLQREELVLTRKEIKGQKEQLEEQNKTLRHQNFENTFFQLLAHFNQIVEEITIITPHGTFNGRVNFQRWYSRIKKRYVDLKQPPSNLSEQDFNKTS